jgi:glycosyltransferase involved in cell wall biosynthesis
MKRVFIILKEDIIHYPPVLTILRILPKLCVKAIHIGVYSDVEAKINFENNGVEFWPTIDYKGNANLISKFKQQLQFKSQVKRYLEDAKITEDDCLWIMQSETIVLLSGIVGKYKTILHFFEHAEPSLNWKYRLLNPLFDLSTVVSKANKIVCCEYNRAQILMGTLQLKELPIILPNKVIVDDNEIKEIPSDIRDIVESVYKKVLNKKVILYQGIFLDGERKLEEFCEAVSSLPDDYAFIAMGKGSDMYERLKKQYESDKIIFIPFIRPPHHLLITQLASIGVLSYFPRKGAIALTLNPLYCAPNKIFEYAKFGIPMISNDIPALKYTYLEYGCGECIPYPMRTDQIVSVIRKVMDSLSCYRQGALNYFESVDVKGIIESVIN